MFILEFCCHLAGTVYKEGLRILFGALYCVNKSVLKFEFLKSKVLCISNVSASTLVSRTHQAVITALVKNLGEAALQVKTPWGTLGSSRTPGPGTRY